MIIKVTQDHIDWGKANSCIHCPIAIALRDYYSPISKTFGVDTGFVHIKPWTDKIKICELPKEAQSFISNFDSYDENPYKTPPKPFEFHLSAEVFML